MNVRTNTMRVYNDCLVDDVAREVGTDVMRISTGGDPDCACAAWEGCIIPSRHATGKTDQEAARSETDKLEIPITRHERAALARLDRA